MRHRSQIDERTITLAAEALSRPEDEREEHLRATCGSDHDLFAKAWSYIQWEKRMQGFLLDPARTEVGDQPPFQPGQVLIRRFHILRKVAQGGMGIVWEAYDEKLDKRVALKCAKSGFGKQLPPEVRAAREISHVNVCKIFDMHTASTPDGEVDFISMEYIEGQTLAQRLRSGPLPKRETHAIALQLCSGLAEAHRRQLIHGDLKTNNAMLTKDPEGSIRVVITDFGLARMSGTKGTTGGTPAYMAPELWEGAQPSVASDIYALGVMLWELRSGRPPTQLGLTSSTLPVGQQVSWKPPSGRSTWDRAIAHCIDPDPNRRFRSATAVAATLQPFRKLKWVFAAVATIVLAVASAIITYQGTRTRPETVRLAVLPFTADWACGASCNALLRNTAGELARLESTPHTRLTFIPLDKVVRHRVNLPAQAAKQLRADYALTAHLEQHGQTTLVHGSLINLSSGVNAREWKGEYKAEELQYAPTALASLVSSTLHLPPPAAGSNVSAAAQNDFRAGVSIMQHDQRLNEAIRDLIRASKSDPDSAVILAGLAEAQWLKYAAARDRLWVDRASASVRQAQLRNPDLAQVHRVAGLLHYTNGWYEQAINEYLRSIELDPRNGDAYRRLGQAYEHNEQIDDALNAFRKAIEIDPHQYRNYRFLANFYANRGLYKQAIEQFLKALDLAPDELALHFRLGVVYQNAGDFASAEKEVRTSITIAETPEALSTLGSILIYEGKDREAAQSFLRALKIGKETSLTWMNLGTAYRRLGQRSDAADAYARGAQLAEAEVINNPRDAFERVQLAYLCSQQNDRRRAESEVAQAVRQSPTDADVLFMVAVTYEALGRRDDTLSVLSASPPGVLIDLNRWPDVADLRNDPRFQQLLAKRTK